MVWTLFLDDERDPATVASASYRRSIGLPPLSSVEEALLLSPDLVVARSFEEAAAAVAERGAPAFVFFDHDLGDGPAGAVSGADFARYLIERDLDLGDLPAGFRWLAHSANPIGRANIDGILAAYMRHRAGRQSS
jgi:hypothetical protein